MTELNQKNKMRNSWLQNFSETSGRKLIFDDLPSQAIKLSPKPEFINEKALWEKVIEMELSLP